jgi:hypothetical protein
MLTKWDKIATLLDFVRDELRPDEGIVFYARKSNHGGGAEYLTVSDATTILEALDHLRHNAEKKNII